MQYKGTLIQELHGAQGKKLAAVLGISILVIASPEDKPLQYVVCIQYLAQFSKRQLNVRALLNSDSKVNIITLANTAKLDLTTQTTNISAHKIAGSALEI